MRKKEKKEEEREEDECNIGKYNPWFMIILMGTEFEVKNRGKCASLNMSDNEDAAV